MEIANSFVCSACGGSGTSGKKDSGCHKFACPFTDDCSKGCPCPSCKGAGSKALCVRTSCVDDSVQHSSSVIRTPKGSKCPMCGKLLKRPLTGPELEELYNKSFIKDEETTINFILTGIEHGMYTFNGLAVTLEPVVEG